jgi:hypothetical protein
MTANTPGNSGGGRQVAQAAEHARAAVRELAAHAGSQPGHIDMPGSPSPWQSTRQPGAAAQWGSPMLRTDLVLKMLCGQNMELRELCSAFRISCRQRLD